MLTTLAQETTVEGADSLDRVYVIDDEIQVLEIVEIQLKAAGFDVQTFPSPELFLQQLPSLAPGVVLSDQRMPSIDGLEVQRQLRQRPNDFKMILLSGFPETQVVVEAMRQGAINVLDKPFDREDMLMSLRTAFSALKRALVEDTRLPGALPDGRLYLETLSPREREVVDLIYWGETNKSIGIILGISVKTVEKHRGKAMKKMNASCLADLIRLMDRELPQTEE